ncbi:MAG: head-tail connector protein [Pseudomonadota bacterium]
MDIETITPAAAEPVTLAEAKAHLRVDHGDEDGLIEALISAARADIETRTRHRFITQTVRLTMSGFPCRIRIPLWPVNSVIQVAYRDEADAEIVLDPGAYTLIKDRRPREVGPAYGHTWPIPRPHWNSVTMDVVVGHGDDGAAAPPDLIAAIKLTLGHLYENREDLVAGVTVQPLSRGAEALLTPHALHI